MTTTTDMVEIQDIGQSMIKSGSRFCKALGRALIIADAQNAQQIKYGFPKYWEYHKNLANGGKEE